MSCLPPTLWRLPAAQERDLKTVVNFLIMLALACALMAPTSPIAQHAERRTIVLASWYGQERAGHRTASGTWFNPNGLTAAHRTLPFGTIQDVTNLANNRQVRVVVTDRGPGIPG